MPLKEDQYFPTEDEVEMILMQVIKPKLDEIENEIDTRFKIKIVAVAQEQEREMMTPDSPNVICKLCFHNTFNENRKVVYVATRTTGFKHISGFSGFDIKGDIKSGVCRPRGYAIVYNLDKFPTW